MDSCLDSYDFETFKTEWGSVFSQVGPILRIIHSYQDKIASSGLDQPITPEELEETQRDWLWLWNRLTGMEHDFFKPYWVPIQKEDYSYFIDLSDKDFPIIESQYFFYEPYQWYKTYLFESTKELLEFCDQDHYPADLNNARLLRIFGHSDFLFAERERLGYEGRLTVEDFTAPEIFLSEKRPVRYYKSETGLYVVYCTGVKSSIVQLLPKDLPLQLINVKSALIIPIDGEEKVKNIGNLLFFLRSNGYVSVIGFEGKITDSEGSWFSLYNGTFVLHHRNKTIVDDFIRLYELTSLQKSGQ